MEKENDIRLSLILPMYNVEEYLERCIRSLQNQDIPVDSYEIICINDGSPDNCSSVIRTLQAEYNNIVLLEQENQGVSVARNNGIEHAHGAYIIFIDPDDFVDANSFRSILEKTDKYDSDVSFLGYTFLKVDGSVHKRVFNEALSSGVYGGIEAYSLARGDGRTDPDRMWAVIFKRKMLDTYKLRFLEDVPYLEDGEFITRILCYASRCIFDGKSFYQRTTRPGSATNSKLFQSQSALDGFFLAAVNLKRFQEDQDLDEFQQRFLNQPIVKFVTLAINSSISWRSLSKMKETFSKLRSLGLRKVNLDGCTREYRRYGRAYNFTPYYAALLLFLLPRIRRIFKVHE